MNFVLKFIPLQVNCLSFRVVNLADVLIGDTLSFYTTDYCPTRNRHSAGESCVEGET